MLIKELSKRSRICVKDLVSHSPLGLLCFLIDCLNAHLPFCDIIDRLEKLDIKGDPMLESINDINLIATVFNSYTDLKSVESVYDIC